MTYEQLMHFYTSMGMSEAEAHAGIVMTAQLKLQAAHPDRRPARGLTRVRRVWRSTLDACRLWQVRWPKPAPATAVA